MGKIGDLIQKITGKERELDKDREAVRATEKVIDNKNAKIKELNRELGFVRERIATKRVNAKNVVKEINEVEEGGVKEGERKEWFELQQRQEGIADRLDAEVRRKERLLAKLEDRVKERDEAREDVQQAEAVLRRDRHDVERMRKRRARIRDQRQAENQPSPSFSYAEWDCNDGTPVSEQAYPAINRWCERVGEPMRARFGSVHINSGYRTAAYNAAIGGASNSFHVYTYHDYKGTAADTTCASGSATDWFNFTAGKADGRGHYATFTHSDLRNETGAGDAVWSG